MKKIFYAIAGIAALSVLSCSKEIDTQDSIVEKPHESVEVPASLRCSVGNPETKVTSDNVGLYKWQSADEITILTQDGNNRTFTAESAGLTSSFEGTRPDDDGLIGGYALYPANEGEGGVGGHSISGSTITFKMPNELTWTADASNMPMYAQITGEVIEEEESNLGAAFKAVGGTMKLICYNIPSGATTLAFTAKSVNIAGAFTVDKTDPDEPVLSGGETKEIDINFTRADSGNMVFYIPLPPVTLTGGFTITIFDDEVNELFSTTTTAAPVIGRNKLVIAPALNCATTPADDATLTNSEIVAEANASSWGSSYGESDKSITNSDGTWTFNAAYQGNVNQDGEYFLQITSGRATVSYIKLPDFTDQIAQVVLHRVCNTNKTTFTGNIYFAGAKTEPVTPIATAPTASSALEDLTIDVPQGYTTGYIKASSACRISAITVKFRLRGITAPIISAEDESLTFAVGEKTKTTTVSLANKVDELGISALVSGTNAENFTASVEGNTLTVTAKEDNTSAADYTATVTLKASGASAKAITVTQISNRVPNPAVTVTPGDNKFTATWTADANATSYVAYLHTSQTATPTSGGSNITSNISNSGSAYSITDYPVTNGTTYYLYVKVNGIKSGYSAPSEFVESTFTPAIWDLQSIAVSTPPTNTTYTEGENFDPTGLEVTPTFEERGNTSNTRTGEPVGPANLEFTPSLSTALTTSDESVTISYTVSGITKSTTQAITVNEDIHYVKVTNLAGVTAGEYIIVSNNTYLPNASTSSAPAAVAVNISNNEVQNVTAAMTWTFTGTSSAMTIRSTADGTPYLYTTNNNNGVRVGNTSGTWTVAVNGSGFSLKFNSTNRYCATTSNNGGDWRSYDSATSQYYLDGGQVYLYKLDDGKSDASISYARSSDTIEYGDSLTPPSLSGAEGFTISCESDNTNVATVNAAGVITVVGNVGTAHVTVSWSEQEVNSTTYRAGSTSYTLTINKATPTIAAFSNPTTSVAVGSTVTNTTTISPNNLTITYTSSDETVATVNASSGVVTGVADGTATISATFAGNANYNAATSQSYTITVGNGGGGGGSTPTEYTVTYTIATTSSVTPSGDAPSGSSATFVNTYTNNKVQITKTNSQTLTLSGFEGATITGLTLSMHSNKSSGSGTFSMVAGTTTLAAISLVTNWNSWYNINAWSQTDFQDVIVVLTNDSYVIKKDEDVVITISCINNNSLYNQSFTITYEK